MAESTHPALEIRLLRSFRVFIHGAQIDTGRWSRRKMRLLIKLLALQPRRQVHRDQIHEMLWPELDADSAANSEIEYKGHFDIKVEGRPDQIASVVILRSDHNTHSFTGCFL